MTKRGKFDLTLLAPLAVLLAVAAYQIYQSNQNPQTAGIKPKQVVAVEQPADLDKVNAQLGGEDLDTPSADEQALTADLTDI